VNLAVRNLAEPTLLVTYTFVELTLPIKIALMGKNGAGKYYDEN